MPLGLTRLNEKHKRPNENISFIKTLDTPDKEIAQDILERVAAIVWPVMRDNYLAVMSLEEFPPNREFWGRNFNAGECIQLVLKSYITGLWLPFPFICKVMLHELAHNKQMNHSRAFHAVRIQFTKELDERVAKGYTGEGFWSRGRTLSSGYTISRELAQEELPDDLCGGTYRKAKKVSQKRKLTYAEQKQKRKERLFGKGEGDNLGADTKARVALEKGKGKSGKSSIVKPRVAQSQRGRDLRLEAALKRAEASKERVNPAASTSHKQEDSDSDTDSEATEYEEDYEERAVDLGSGNHGVKVEEEERQDDADIDEWREMQDEMKLLCATSSGSTSGGSSTSLSASKQDTPKLRPPSNVIRTGDEREQSGPSSQQSPPSASPLCKEKTLSAADAQDRGEDVACQICTTINGIGNTICEVCSNVLDRHRTRSWDCMTASCVTAGFSNPLDAGVCGLCGARKQASLS